MYCVFSTCAGKAVYVSLCGEGGSKRCDEEVREAITVMPGATSKVEFVVTSSGATDVVPGEAIPLRSFGRLV